ncbi:MAG: glycosyltransferase [Bacteroidales bacterium]|nr:glycosyltransferase [Bacteroidales bacterium]
MTANRKRVILFVSTDLSCDNRVHKVASSLSNSGYEVEVVGRKLKQSLSLLNQCYNQKRLRFLFTKGPLFYAEMNIRFFLYLIFRRFDIATANDLDTLLGVFCATRLRGKQIVYDSHEYFTEVPELQNRLITRKTWLAIEKWTFPKLHFVTTVCNSIAKEYEVKYGIPVQVVRNVPYKIDACEKKKLNLPHSKVVLYQGALNVGRGLELLIESFVSVDACLLIIGDGDIRARLEAMVSQLNLCGKVIFLGKIPYNNLPAYTQLATIGVSLEEDLGASYHYCLPNKLFDYIQAGKPVLVSDLPEMRAIISRYSCGEIFIERNAKSLANQLNELLRDEQRLQLYQANCLTASVDLCWEKEEQNLLSVYSQLM